jgi:all-trans-retinol 13,14-reductase
LSTPLSTHFFKGHPGGVIYGIPATPDRYRQDWLKIRTPIKNLFLTGSDIASHGISGAMFGGVLTSAVVMGFPLGFFRIIAGVKYHDKKHINKIHDSG